MEYDYFYNQEVEQYIHFQIPTVLFECDKLNTLSINAKFMYCLLFERAKLSFKNNIVDEKGRIYIHYSQADLKKLLNCGRTKITDYFNELDGAKGGVGLIERKQRNGVGKGDIIYVKNFAKVINENNSDDLPETGSYSYFHDMGGMRFNFYRVPKVLFVDDKIKTVSNIAKMAYVFMLNRTSLSKANNWVDENGRIYIIYTQEELQAILHCSKPTIIKAMNELEQIHLIERKKQCMNRPDIIYVLDFSTNLKYQTEKFQSVHNMENVEYVEKSEDLDLLNIGGKKSEHREVKNLNIGGKKSEHREVKNLNIGGKKSEHIHISNIDNSNIDFNHIHFSQSAESERMNENNTTNKKMTFSDMLQHIGYDCYIEPDETDDEYEPYSDLLKKCRIPYSLANNSKNIEMALKFIFGYNFYQKDLSELNRYFFKDVIKNLTEMITKPDGKINPNEVIDRINDILSCYSPYDWFLTLIDNWTSVVKSKNEHGETIKFPDKLLKTVMFNWLKNHHLDEDCMIRTIPDMPRSVNNGFNKIAEVSPVPAPITPKSEPKAENTVYYAEKKTVISDCKTTCEEKSNTKPVYDEELLSILKNGIKVEDISKTYFDTNLSLDEKILWFDKNIDNWREANCSFFFTMLKDKESRERTEKTHYNETDTSDTDNTEELKKIAFALLENESNTTTSQTAYITPIQPRSYLDT